MSVYTACFPGLGLEAKHWCSEGEWRWFPELKQGSGQLSERKPLWVGLQVVGPHPVAITGTSLQLLHWWVCGF